VIERVLPWNEVQRVCRAALEAYKINPTTGYGVWGCAKAGYR
jgi:hypothetical protein